MLTFILGHQIWAISRNNEILPSTQPSPSLEWILSKIQNSIETRWAATSLKAAFTTLRLSAIWKSSWMKHKRQSKGKWHTRLVFRWHRNTKPSSKTRLVRMDSPRQRFKHRLICLCLKSGLRDRAWAYLGRGSSRNINSGLVRTPKLPSIQELNFSTGRFRQNENERANQSLRV
jgi:hypothetical protein